MKQGMSPEEAIPTPNKQVKPVSYLGEDFAIAEFCDFYGVSRATARSRLRANWALEDIINKPTRYRVKVITGAKNIPLFQLYAVNLMPLISWSTSVSMCLAGQLRKQSKLQKLKAEVFTYR